MCLCCCNPSIVMMCSDGLQIIDRLFHSLIVNQTLQPTDSCLTNTRHRHSLLTTYLVLTQYLSSWTDTITWIRCEGCCSWRNSLKLASLPGLSLHKLHTLSYSEALRKTGLVRLDTRREKITQSTFRQVKCPTHPLHYMLPPRKVSTSQMTLRPTYPYSAPKCKKQDMVEI